MNSIKPEGTKRSEDFARFCASISNHRRIKILEALACKNGCESKIDEVAGLSKFTVAINLKYLKKFGLIKGSFTSKNTSYCIDYQKLEEFKSLFDAFYNDLVTNKPRTNSEMPCINKK